MIIIELFSTAVKIFHTEANAINWFNAACPELDGEKPIDFLNDINGIDQVFHALHKIDQNNSLPI